MPDNENVSMELTPAHLVAPYTWWPKLGLEEAKECLGALRILTCMGFWVPWGRYGAHWSPQLAGTWGHWGREVPLGAPGIPRVL